MKLWLLFRTSYHMIIITVVIGIITNVVIIVIVDIVIVVSSIEQFWWGVGWKLWCHFQWLSWICDVTSGPVRLKLWRYFRSHDFQSPIGWGWDWYVTSGYVTSGHAISWVTIFIVSNWATQYHNWLLVSIFICRVSLIYSIFCLNCFDNGTWRWKCITFVPFALVFRVLVMHCIVFRTFITFASLFVFCGFPFPILHLFMHICFHTI